LRYVKLRGDQSACSFHCNQAHKDGRIKDAMLSCQPETGIFAPTDLNFSPGASGRTSKDEQKFPGHWLCRNAKGLKVRVPISF
jgi:hypothetical protein